MQNIMTLRDPPPPDPAHPEYQYDTFFSCLAYHVEGAFERRIHVRDRLLCHLGSIVFDKRYERSYDVVETGRSCGASILKRRLFNEQSRKQILAHPAVQSIIARRGAYTGCNTDERGGQRLGSTPAQWARCPKAFSWAISQFVEENLGYVPSAPRNGTRGPQHKCTTTTCFDTFLYLAIDLYPKWRPVVWTCPNGGAAAAAGDWTDKVGIRSMEYLPNFHGLAGDPITLDDQWYNNAHPIYMFYDGDTRRFRLLLPSSSPSCMQSPPLFQLRRTNATKTDNVTVGYFCPPNNNHNTTTTTSEDATRNRIHAFQLDSTHIDTKCFYMVYPADIRHRSFRVSQNERLFIYVVRPSQSFQEEWNSERHNRLWQAPGRPSGRDSPFNATGDCDAEGTLPHQDDNGHVEQVAHVLLYKSHEGRTGVWPIFSIAKDTCEIVVIVARDRSAADAILQDERPHQPLMGAAPLKGT